MKQLMNKVSILSREIVNEIQALTNSCVTVDDYLKIRNQAALEIQNGMFNETNIVVSNPVPSQTVQEKVSVPVMNQANQQVVNQPNVTDSKLNFVKKAAHKNQTVIPIQTQVANEEYTIDNSDPFFAMCNKI